MTRRRILCRTLMLVIMVAVCLIAGIGYASAEVTITSVSIGNAATISSIDEVTANVVANTPISDPVLYSLTYRLDFTVKLYEDGVLWNTQIGDTKTFTNIIQNTYNEYQVTKGDTGDILKTANLNEAISWFETLDNAKLYTVSSGDYFIEVKAAYSAPLSTIPDESPAESSPTMNIQVSTPSISWSRFPDPGQTISININQVFDLNPGNPIFKNVGGNSPEGYVTVITDSTNLQLLDPIGYSGSTTTVYNGQTRQFLRADGSQSYFDGYIADAYKAVPTNSEIGFNNIFIKPTDVGTYRVYWRGALDTPDNGYNFVRSPISGTKDPLGYDANYITIQVIPSALDTINPTISISSPTSGQTVSTSSLTVSGIADDNVELSKVEVKVGSGSWQLASLSGTSWSKSVTLASGSNTIYAKATDTSNNIKETSVVVTYTPPPGNTAPNTPSSPSGPTSGYIGTSYTFSTSTADPDGDNIYYTFDWDDGTTAISSTAASGNSVSKSHSWSTSGTYNVKVQATDVNGASSGWSSSSSITISAPPSGNTAPNTPSSPSGPTSGYTGTSYSFSTSTTDPDGDNIYYNFDWGDNWLSQTLFTSSGATISSSHSWSTSGIYTVKVQAVDGNVASGWSSSSISINEKPNSLPTASITSILPNPVNEGELVSFTGGGYDSDGTITGWEWSSNFDGIISSVQSFSASTLSPEWHIISYRVQDNDGEWSTEVKEALYINKKPTASITSISPNPAIEKQTISFTGSGIDSDGSITEYNWRSDIDGQLNTSISFSTSTLSAGTHTIFFKVKDNNDAWSNEMQQTLTVEPDVTPPTITVYMSDGQTVGENLFYIEGFVEDDVGIKNILINGNPVYVDDSLFITQSDFLAYAELDKGDNIITISATDLSNNQNDYILHVNLDREFNLAGNANILWNTTTNGHNGVFYDAGDISGDGKTDIVLYETDFITFSNSYNLTSYSGADGSKVWDVKIDVPSDVFRMDYNYFYYGEYQDCEITNIGDLNGDGVDDHVIALYNYKAGVNFITAISGVDGSKLWDSTYNIPYLTQIGDVNNDARNDIMIINIKLGVFINVSVLSGVDGNSIWSHTESGFDAEVWGDIWGDPTGDLNRDGVNDLLILVYRLNDPVNSELKALDGKTGSLIWNISEYNLLKYYTILDADGDGFEDVLVSTDWSETTAVRGDDASQIWTADGHPIGVINDIDSDGFEDVIVTTTDYYNDIEVTQLIALSGNTGGVIWTKNVSEVFWSESGYESEDFEDVYPLGDENGDGVPDFVATSEWGTYYNDEQGSHDTRYQKYYGISGLDGTILWNKEFIESNIINGIRDVDSEVEMNSILDMGPSGQHYVVFDVDSYLDGFYHNWIAVRGINGDTLWNLSSNDESPRFDPIFADFDNDGMYNVLDMSIDRSSAPLFSRAQMFLGDSINETIWSANSNTMIYPFRNQYDYILDEITFNPSDLNDDGSSEVILLNGGELYALTFNGANRAPILYSMGPKSIDENSTLEFILNASEADGDPITYSAVDLPEGASLDGSSGLFTWTPTYQQAGIYPLQFSVTDGILTDSETVAITVNDVSKAPVLELIGPQYVDENTTLSFTLNVSDANGDSLTYFAFNLPTDATFDNSSGLFTWTPTYEQAGIYFVEFNVTDGTLSDFEIVTITVDDVNAPPFIDFIPQQYVDENTTLSFMLNAFDVDGDTLTYSVSDLPNGASFDDVVGFFIWTPTYEQAGTYSVEFNVTDGLLIDYETVNITVYDVNRAPVLDLIGSKSVYENTTLSFTLNASDADGDLLTYSAVDLPESATLDGSNGLFTWIPTHQQVGEYSVEFNVTDGTDIDSETVNITVILTPPPTESISIGSATAALSSTVTIPVSLAYTENMTGFSFDLVYNSSVVTVSSVSANANLAGAGITPNIDNTNGITRVLLTGSDFITVSSETPVIDITFDVIGDFGSSTSLVLENVEFSDSDFNPYIPDGIVNGSITVGMNGDLNNNGYVDIGDVAKVAFMVAGKVPEELSADFNNNGYVDIGDAAKIAFYLAGKVSEL